MVGDLRKQLIELENKRKQEQEQHRAEMDALKQKVSGQLPFQTVALKIIGTGHFVNTIFRCILWLVSRT